VRGLCLRILNTAVSLVPSKVRAEYIKQSRMVEKFSRGIPTVICSVGSISFIPRDVKDGAFNRNENWFSGVSS
jgi:hypothetical protein